MSFLEFVNDQLHIYPLWLCPLRPGRYDKLSPAYIQTDLVIDVGVWGEVDQQHGNFVASNRETEKITMKLNGRKLLYAHAYYPPEEFWKIYDQAWYSELRDKYFASEVFPDVYEKTKVSEKYTASIWGGIWKALRSSKLPIS